MFALLVFTLTACNGNRAIPLSDGSPNNSPDADRCTGAPLTWPLDCFQRCQTDGDCEVTNSASCSCNILSTFNTRYRPHVEQLVQLCLQRPRPPRPDSGLPLGCAGWGCPLWAVCHQARCEIRSSCRKPGP